MDAQRASVRHRLTRVQREVQECLPEHRRIAVDVWRAAAVHDQLSARGFTFSTEIAALPVTELRERVLREITAFVGDAPQHDDMTMILLKVDRPSA